MAKGRIPSLCGLLLLLAAMTLYDAKAEARRTCGHDEYWCSNNCGAWNNWCRPACGDWNGYCTGQSTAEIIQRMSPQSFFANPKYWYDQGVPGRQFDR